MNIFLFFFLLNLKKKISFFEFWHKLWWMKDFRRCSSIPTSESPYDVLYFTFFFSFFTIYFIWSKIICFLIMESYFFWTTIYIVVQKKKKKFSISKRFSDKLTSIYILHMYFFFTEFLNCINIFFLNFLSVLIFFFLNFLSVLIMFFSHFQFSFLSNKEKSIPFFFSI